jgi:DNA primase
MLWRMVEVPVLCFDGDKAGQRAAMRAITRALPMLAPMRSLSIVRLPAGMDPDDLIAKQGAGAMEKLLSEPKSLLDSLWEFERDAAPLDSPESKAGLKARLMEHVDTIADRDIQSLYRRELLDRFSEFAYPPRAPRAANAPRSGPWRGGKAAQSGLSQEARATLQRAMGGGQRSGLLDAVIAGFALHPQEISRHAEALTRLAKHDRQAAPAIESLIELSETLDSDTQNTIFGEQGYPAPPDRNRYAFLREGTLPGDAREELAEAVSLLAHKPALEAAMAATIARFDEDPEGSFAEQARLRQQLMTVEERLKAFGRRKAAAEPSGATKDLTSAASASPEDGLETD